MKFPYEPMEVKEQCSVEGITYFMVQTKSSRDGWEVADIRPDIPNQRKVANLLAAAPDLIGDLCLAAEILRKYETLHRAKNTEESTAKAEVNADLASRFEATIDRARGEA